LAVQIDRATAHTRNHAGVFRFFTGQANQDDVPFRTVRVLQNPENFHPHGFGLGSLKYGIGDAVHAGVNLTDRNRLKGFRKLNFRDLGLRSLGLRSLGLRSSRWSSLRLYLSLTWQ